MPRRIVCLALVCALTLMAAQSAATISAAGSATIVASGLKNPKGFTWSQDGTLYIAEADQGAPVRPQVEGSPELPAGTPDASAGAKPTVPGIGQTHAGSQLGSVVKIAGGCPVPAATGFPSVTDPNLGWAFGVSAVAFLDGHLYALVDGGGASTQNPNLPNGVYRVNDDGSHMLVANISAWIHDNKVSDPHEPLTPDGEPFAMIANGGALWITESNHEQLLRITPDGAITRVVDFSPLGDTVPTGLVAAPDGGVYVGFLSPLPFTDGASKVMKVDASGKATDAWTGLTAVTGVAVGPDGALYAAELTTGAGSGQQPPFVVPGSGKVVKQTGPSTSADVATGLTAPTALVFGPDGGLYVSGPGIGSYNGEGMILRLDPSSMTEVAMTARPSAGCATGAQAMDPPALPYPLSTRR